MDLPDSVPAVPAPSVGAAKFQLCAFASLLMNAVAAKQVADNKKCESFLLREKCFMEVEVWVMGYLRRAR